MPTHHLLVEAKEDPWQIVLGDVLETTVANLERFKKLHDKMDQIHYAAKQKRKHRKKQVQLAADTTKEIYYFQPCGSAMVQPRRRFEC